MRVRSLEDIVASDLCMGCGICQAVASDAHVRMGMDGDGFLRPKVLGDYGKSWETIRQVCPGLSVQHDGVSSDRAGDKLWGPILDLKAGYATDHIIRWRGSSGGAVSALLCFLLESYQADCVLQIGASLSNPLHNQVYLSRNREDIIKCAGSRYAPAAPLTYIKRLLEQTDGRMAFVGKPCDVAAFRAFLRLQPELSYKVTCMISFFCAGTSSVHATEDVIATMGTGQARVVDFRYRGHGWPGQTQAVTADGLSYEMSYQESWGKILARQLQFRCKICADGVGELADIVCGDAWSTEDDQPDFEERPGRSLILCRTEVGRSVVSEAENEGYLVTEPFHLWDLEVIQPYQAMRRKLVASRLLAMSIAGVPRPRYRGFRLVDSALQVPLQENWNSFKGMLRRLKARQRYEGRFVFRLLTVIAAVVSRTKRSMQAAKMKGKS